MYASNVWAVYEEPLDRLNSRGRKSSAVRSKRREYNVRYDQLNFGVNNNFYLFTFIDQEHGIRSIYSLHEIQYNLDL